MWNQPLCPRNRLRKIRIGRKLSNGQKVKVPQSHGQKDGHRPSARVFSMLLQRWTIKVAPGWLPHRTTTKVQLQITSVSFPINVYTLTQVILRVLAVSNSCLDMPTFFCHVQWTRRSKYGTYTTNADACTCYADTTQLKILYYLLHLLDI